MKAAHHAKNSHDQAGEIKNTRRATSNLLEDMEAERTALVVAKKREDALLASIGDGVIGTDPEGRIILMNAAAKRILDLTIEKVLGRDLFESIALENEEGKVISKNDRPVSMVFKTGVAVSINSLYYIDKDKRKVPLAIDITPIVLKKKIIGTVNVFRDISKEKELERAKDEFISLASHQLQSPVTAISWSLERLLGEHKGPLNKEQKESIEEVLGVAQNMTDLVNGFLQVTRMESTGFAIEKADVDLVQIADSVLKELEGKIAEKKTIIIKNYGTDVPHLTIGEKRQELSFKI
jgi:PAS domain S-box-containing protein